MAANKLPRLADGDVVIDGRTWNETIAPGIERRLITGVAGGLSLLSSAAGQLLSSRIQTIPQIIGFWARITGFTAIGTTGSGGTQSNRWSYNWTEQQYVQTGGWQNLSGGRTSAGTALAYNSIEANNSASGIQGNSITVSTLGPGQEILPVQGSPVVWMRAVITCNSSGSGGSGSGSGSGSSGQTEYIFSYENAVGPCGSGS